MMIWSDEAEQFLRQSWAKRDGSCSILQFDLWIAERVGCSGKAVKRKRERLGLVLPISGGAEEQEGDNDEQYYAGSLAEEKGRLQKEQERRHYKRLKADAAKRDLLIDAVRAAASLIPERELVVAAPPRGEGKCSDQEALVLISDVQIGEWVDSEATGGLGDYDMNIFENRAQVLTDRVERILRLHQQTHPIKTLKVLLNGDMVEGHGIYRSQPEELCSTITEQVLEGADVFARMVIYWAGLVDSLEVHCVYGNHGRVSYEAAVKDNWDYILYRFMEKIVEKEVLERAKLPRHMGKITFQIPRTWWHLVRSKGHGLLMIHGDDIKSSLGLPFYGAERAEGRLRGLIPGDFEYLLIGHHHRHCNFETNRGEILMNGNWVGGSILSLKNMQLTSRPSQLIFGVSASHGITWRYRIHLDEE